MRKKKTPKLTIFSTLFVIFLVGTAILVVSDHGEKRFLPSETKTSTTATITPLPRQPRRYSDEEKHAFWDLHLNSIFMEQLPRGTYPIKEVSDRYRTLVTEIVKRYQTPLHLEASTSYNEYYVYAIAGCDMNGSVPIVRIFVPGVMYVYEELQATALNDPLWQKRFEVFAVVTIMHEIDHVAIGKIGTRFKTRKELIDGETDAWAETSEYTISAFVKLGLPIDPSSTRLYNGWDTCGRQNNACWLQSIEAAYAPVAQH